MKTSDEWKNKLTPEQYQVMREKGTETPFTGEYLKHNQEGIYQCAACGNPLFRSDTKFDSGTGWPSFFDILNNNSIATEVDNSRGRTRIEVHCKQCGSHLGHVFTDGPAPTGKRYCINSVSLNFKKINKE